MHKQKFFFLLLILFLAFNADSCSKKKEEKAKAEKKEEVLIPPLSQPRIELWFGVAERVGEFIRKFSLENEEADEKRELMILAHSSVRTQTAYGKIFKDMGMSVEEFWKVMDELKKVKKYFRIKEDESVQNKDLHALIEAGREEIAALKLKMERMGISEKSSAEETIKTMEAKIDEFQSMKGNIKPESVGINDDLIALWKKNGNKFEEAFSSMWKVKVKREENDAHF